MDEYLLEQWNNCVGVNDIVYILGDLFFRNAGVDINHFRPVTFAELVKNNQKFKDSVV